MIPVWIAHRGYPTRFPENTMVGYEAAIQLGAKWLETDIQLSRDGVPMLYHDETLDRVSQRRGLVRDWTAAELQAMPASHEDRFGSEYASERIAPLASLISRLQTADGVQIMVELKGESLDHFGITEMVERVMQVVRPIADLSVIISFNLAALHVARRLTGTRIGWVLPEWSEAIREQADAERPDYLIVDCELLPPSPTPLWPGSWQWAVYSIDEPSGVKPMLDRGISLLETNCIAEMIRSER